MACAACERRRAALKKLAGKAAERAAIILNRKKAKKDAKNAEQ